jgi:organic hydroperoxide reductase OsmC/OhrA
MTGRAHHYEIEVEWVGNQGSGTSGYRDYARDHLIHDPEGLRPDIPGSSDPNFRGSTDRWNPEQLLLASVSACHKLWYLHLCAVNQVVVTAYVDRAEGWMAEAPSGGGRFTRALLKPHVRIAAGSDPDKARALHHDANAQCFVANSLNFPVEHQPVIEVEGAA